MGATRVPLDGTAAEGTQESRRMGRKTLEVPFDRRNATTHFFLMLGHSLRTSSLQAILNL